jgi:hypothetical protein
VGTTPAFLSGPNVKKFAIAEGHCFCSAVVMSHPIGRRMIYSLTK